MAELVDDEVEEDKHNMEDIMSDKFNFMWQPHEVYVSEIILTM